MSVRNLESMLFILLLMSVFQLICWNYTSGDFGHGILNWVVIPYTNGEYLMKISLIQKMKVVALGEVNS